MQHQSDVDLQKEEGEQSYRPKDMASTSSQWYGDPVQITWTKRLKMACPEKNVLCWVSTSPIFQSVLVQRWICMVDSSGCVFFLSTPDDWCWRDISPEYIWSYKINLVSSYYCIILHTVMWMYNISCLLCHARTSIDLVGITESCYHLDLLPL